MTYICIVKKTIATKSLMKKSHLIGGWIAALLVVTALHSCVNKDYDLKKDNIDTTVQLLPGLDVTLSADSTVYLKDIIKIDGNKYVTTDANGDYKIAFTPDASIGQLSFEVGGIPASSAVSASATVDVTSSVTSTISGAGISALNLLTKTLWTASGLADPIAVADIAKSTDVDLGTISIPAEVKAIKNAKIGATIEIGFSINTFGAVTLTKGSVITFPEWFKLTTATTGFEVDADKPYLLKVSADRRVLPSETITCTVSEIDLSGETIASGKLALKSAVKYEGGIQLAKDDLDETAVASAEGVTLAATFGFGAITFSEITADVEAAITQDIASIAISGLPSIVEEAAQADIDMADIIAVMAVEDNTLPLAIDFSTALKPRKGSSVKTVAISGVTIPAAKDITFAFVEKGQGASAPSGATKVEVPGISDLLVPIPDAVDFSPITATVKGELTVAPGTTFSATPSLSIEAPLAFGENLVFESSHTVSGLDISFGDDIKFREVDITCTLTNGTPVKGEILGVSIDGYDVTVTGSVPPGKSTLVIKAVPTGSTCPAIKAVTASYRVAYGNGTTLNENQSVTISDVSVSIPDGVLIEL